MHNTKKIILLALALVLLSAAPALAATGGELSIDLPTSAQVDAKDDMSAGIFSQVLGPVWAFVCGDNNAFGGLGKYSGLILAILGAFNVAGLAIVSVIVGYQWVVAAVATAESGKVGGGVKFGSMWTPFRHALSVTLCVPVLHGVSLIQIIVIACFGMGINAANYVWGEASTYIVQHVDAGTTDTQSAIIDSESLQAVQPLFQGVMLQEVLKYSGADYPNKDIQQYETPSFRSQFRQISVQGDYVIEMRPLEGKAYLWLMTPAGQDLGVLGGIAVPAPIATLESGTVKPSGDPATYNAALAITHIRLQELAKMAEALRPWARYHLAVKSGDTKIPPKPETDGLDIAEAYRRNVSQAAAGHLATAAARGGKVDQRIATALGVRNDGKTPDGGWMTAGILPHILATASDQADVLNYGSGVRPVIIDTGSGTYSTDANVFSKAWGWWTSKAAIEPVYAVALDTAPAFATQMLLRGRSWSGHDIEGEGPGTINKMITWAFTKDGYNNMGILPTTMRDFEEKNPLSAMMTTGDRFLSIGSIAFGVSAVAGLASAIPGAPGAIAGLVNNGAFIAVMCLLLTVGFTLKYLVPIMPMLYWIKGVIVYFVSALTAIVAAPLWIFAFALPEGEGMVGQHARKGLLTLLDITIRPPLMVTFLCIAYALMHAVALVVVAIFAKWVNAAIAYTSVDVVWQLSMSCAINLAIYTSTFLLFGHFLLKAAQNVVPWIGQNVGGGGISSIEGSGDKESGMMGGAAAKGAAAAGGIGAGLAGAAGSVLNKDKNKGGDKGGDKPKADLPANVAAKEDGGDKPKSE